MASTSADGFQLAANAAGTLVLSGAISYENAAQVYRAVPIPALGTTARTTLDMDLTALRDVDSATLAVLIGWSAHAHEQGTNLRYLNAPQALRNLARLSDVDGLLGLEAG